jgi:hypothetical protein
MSFIVYLKNKTSHQFEYKSDVSAVVCTGNGYRITFNNGRSYHYGADKVKFYPLVSTRENNNSAVFNVREKLEKYGYGMIVASLGNNDNKTSFFDHN